MAQVNSSNILLIFKEHIDTNTYIDWLNSFIEYKTCYINHSQGNNDYPFHHTSILILFGHYVAYKEYRFTKFHGHQAVALVRIHRTKVKEYVELYGTTTPFYPVTNTRDDQMELQLNDETELQVSNEVDILFHEVDLTDEVPTERDVPDWLKKLRDKENQKIWLYPIKQSSCHEIITMVKGQYKSKVHFMSCETHKIKRPKKPSLYIYNMIYDIGIAYCMMSLISHNCNLLVLSEGPPNLSKIDIGSWYIRQV